MGAVHIIVLYIIFVALTAAYFIAKEITTDSKISKEQDFVNLIIAKKKRELEKKNSTVSISLYLKILMIAPIVCGVFMYIMSNSGIISVLIGVMGLFIPEMVVEFLRHDADKKFEERFARSLEQLGSSLRAGMSISQAVDDVANCRFIHESMRKKYAKISSDLQMGISVCEAFSHFAEGTNSEAAHDVAIAIDVQNEVGGHEAEVIEEIASSIYDRIMLQREIKSIFSGTSSMVWMMDFIGPLVIIWFSISNKEYVDTYFSSPFYIVLFILFIIMMITGSILNHRTIKKISKGA